MSYVLEREVLTNFIVSKDNFGLNGSAFGMDGGVAKAANNSGFMTILNGQATIRSIGGPGLRVVTTSLLVITFFVAGGKSSSEAKIIVDNIVDTFFDLKLNEDGVAPNGASEMLLDFGAQGLAPYPASSVLEAPFIRTTVNVPFTRTELKQRELV